MTQLDEYGRPIPPEATASDDVPIIELFVCPDCGALYWNTHQCKTALHDGWFEITPFGLCSPSRKGDG